MEHFFEGITPFKTLVTFITNVNCHKYQAYLLSYNLSNPYNGLLILYGNVPLMHKCKIFNHDICILYT